MEKVKVINTTVKKPRILNGKDMRSAAERKGFGVTFSLKDGSRPRLNPGRSLIIEPTDPGLLKLEGAGYVRIERGDIGDQLGALSLNPSKVPAAKVVKKEVAPVEGGMVENKVVEEAPVVEETEEKSEPRLAHVVEMGKDEHKGRDFLNDEDAVDPDGQPNFVVQAPSAETRKRRKRKKKNKAEEADIL